MLHKFIGAISGEEDGNKRKIRGTVVLMKKNVLDFNDFNAAAVDNLSEFLGKRISLQLISSVHGDRAKGLRGKIGKPAHLEDWITTSNGLAAGESAFDVTFDYDDEIGVPGAFVVKNNHHNQFYLRTLTLEDFPGHGRIYFVCNSWVYPADKYKSDRVFFANQAYLPGATPLPLLGYREEELKILRGNGSEEDEFEEWDRVYDYALYNDLGDPDKGSDHVRPTLGGSKDYPYPRRGKTGRKPTKTDPKSESKLPLVLSLTSYVPRDERFGHLKMADFLGYNLKSVVQALLPELEGLFDSTPNEFDSFEDVLNIYKGGIPLPDGPFFEKIKNNVQFEFIRELLRTDGAHLLKYPEPQVIKEDKSDWITDEEFGREMLAGINPVSIRRLQEFPPASGLDHRVYGDQTSSISKQHIEKNLDGLTTNEAIENNKLFILDHHDTIMPYLRKINATSSKIYATRTLLFLKADGTLKPLAIELSLPHPNGDEFGSVSQVYTPSTDKIESALWLLAKAYVSVNDSGVHQLISHWLHTHAAIEPFVIATNRQLSVLHPIHKLLHPHFRDTMNINGIARQILINAGGLLEFIFFSKQYSMEMSAVVYKDWVFPDQALPADLLKRYPEPQVIKEDKSDWITDEEFGREMLAGINPVSIRRLQEFPPASGLDHRVYGDQTSSISKQHIEKNLDGLTTNEAIENNKLFILDHHDTIMPYLRKINATSSKIYATRTLLFLKADGTLKPLAIELSLPHPNGDEFGSVSQVYTPSTDKIESALWLLAKAYVSVNDSGVHQLISHWLHTHAAIEPFVIATNRQLSVLHPIHKLLHPHFRDTMNINGIARQILINAGGLLEFIFFSKQYSMEMSAVVYKDWVFPDQALPADLLKRGVAVEDGNSPHGLRLLIEDYPYAVDGLEIWSAIKTWVEDYCSFYYKSDETVRSDPELQSWWEELRSKGHGDKKDEPWWPKMQTIDELTHSCTIIIWIASALHAAVNFGQYPYAGYMPNRPTTSRRLMPEKGSADYKELESNPEKAFLKTVTMQLQTLVGISIIEILSRHSSDEVYLGKNENPEWTSDAEPLEAFKRFGKKLEQIEERIVRMNSDAKLKNRNGPVKVPYTLLYPTGEEGIAGKGIPNSVSI